MTEPRLMIDAALAEGVEIALDEAQSRHVGTVLRREVGDALRAFNARDGEWRARVAEKTKRGMRVRVETFVRAAVAAPDLDLLFAPVKRHATDLIVEKATELGVRRIRPVITQRTIAETVRVDRLAAIAREAAEQTERFDAPEVLEPISLARVLDGWDAKRALVYADERGDDASAPWGGDVGRATAIVDAMNALPPWGKGWVGGRATAASLDDDVSISSATSRPVVRPLPQPPPQGAGDLKLALLIGPEGGFTEDERRMLRGLPFVTPVLLGPRILRAETAVIAALSVIQALWGDWRGA